ncbi:hypothetical protein Tco_0105923 [Tanacetum coccineum]
MVLRWRLAVDDDGGWDGEVTHSVVHSGQWAVWWVKDNNREGGLAAGGGGVMLVMGRSRVTGECPSDIHGLRVVIKESLIGEYRGREGSLASEGCRGGSVRTKGFTRRLFCVQIVVFMAVMEVAYVRLLGA